MYNLPSFCLGERNIRQESILRNQELLPPVMMIFADYEYSMLRDLVSFYLTLLKKVASYYIDVNSFDNINV
jgi:hypothetical protein